MELMIDSGADVNILNEEQAKVLELGRNSGDIMIYDINRNPSVRVRAFAARGDLPVECTFSAWIKPMDERKPKNFAEFIVVKGASRSLLGRETARRMRLLAMGSEVNEIAVSEEATAEFPAIPGPQIDFEIDPREPAVRRPYVNIPVHFQRKAVDRLEDMEKSGIIERVRTAPRWLSGMAAVPKGKDDFRLVINMKGPNRAIKREYHAMPRIEEMRTKLHGASRFTKLDMKSAFHHVRLGEKSRELTNFMTPIGMFRFKRLMFGVNCAPEIFQRIMEDVLKDIEGIIVYIDDVLIFAKDEKGLEETTAKVLRALETNNLLLNEGKCEYNKERLTFLGHQVSKEGLDIDEQKVASIRNFRKPQSASEIRSLLGLATFVSPHIERFADLTEPLRRAAKAEEFIWEQEQEQAFEALKKAVIKCTVTLGYFDPEGKTYLYTDASPYAIGAVLVQEDETNSNRIISFASKALTKTEQRYAQPQREALAVVWAAEHFYYYLLGHRFTIRTDASALTFIYGHKEGAQKRLLTRAEGWAMRLDIFDYDIEYVPGKKNIADTPSRLHTGSSEAFDESCKRGEIANITIEQPEDMTFESGYLSPIEVALATETDEELQAIMEALITGEWSDELKDFRSLKEELTVRNGVVVRTGLAVIPRTLRNKALAIAHKGHPGSTKMKSILRARVWWPRMGKHTEEWVKLCRECLLMGKAEPPTPMQRTRLPEAPWDAIAVDFCGPYAMFGGIHVLSIVDYYSRFMIAIPLTTTSFEALRPAYEGTFRIWGFPEAIKSDNASVFTAREYKRYCANRGIEIVHSFPLTPQQNGAAERSMQTIAKAMGAASDGDKDYMTALRDATTAHNTAKHRVTGIAPEELMYGRRVRRYLPLMESAVTDHDRDELRERDDGEKMKAKVREDKKRGARDTSIEPGDTVVLKRAVRRKGETVFDPTELTVQSKRRGDLTLLTPQGVVVKRNVVLAKKLPPRGIDGTAASSDTHDATSSSNEESRPKRSAEARARPNRLRDYVAQVNQESGVNMARMSE